jgi:hypothetical protein
MDDIEKALTHNSKVTDSEPSWSSVDKRKLPMRAFAYEQADPDMPSSWSYPHHYVVGGAVDEETGRYKSGDMYLHKGGLNAAWAAANGSRSGKKAPQWIIDHLQKHRKALGLEEDEKSVHNEIEAKGFGGSKLVVKEASEDEDQRRVCAIVYYSDRPDLYADYMEPDELVKAKERFDTAVEKGTAGIDYRHDFIFGAGKVIRSWIVKDSDEIFKAPEDVGAWAIEIEVDSQHEFLWEAIKNEEINAVSMAGSVTIGKMKSFVIDEADKDRYRNSYLDEETGSWKVMAIEIKNVRVVAVSLCQWGANGAPRFPSVKQSNGEFADEGDWHAIKIKALEKYDDQVSDDTLPGKSLIQRVQDVFKRDKGEPDMKEQEVRTLVEESIGGLRDEIPAMIEKSVGGSIEKALGDFFAKREPVAKEEPEKDPEQDQKAVLDVIETVKSLQSDLVDKVDEVLALKEEVVSLKKELAIIQEESTKANEVFESMLKQEEDPEPEEFDVRSTLQEVQKTLSRLTSPPIGGNRGVDVAIPVSKKRSDTEVFANLF